MAILVHFCSSRPICASVSALCVSCISSLQWRYGKHCEQSQMEIPNGFKNLPKRILVEQTLVPWAFWLSSRSLGPVMVDIFKMSKSPSKISLISYLQKMSQPKIVHKISLWSLHIHWLQWEWIQRSSIRIAAPNLTPCSIASWAFSNCVVFQTDDCNSVSTHFDNLWPDSGLYYMIKLLQELTRLILFVNSILFISSYRSGINIRLISWVFEAEDGGFLCVVRSLIIYSENN